MIVLSIDVFADAMQYAVAFLLPVLEQSAPVREGREQPQPNLAVERDGWWSRIHHRTR